MICQKCGHDNPPEARYCAECGVSLTPSITPGVGSSYTSAWQKLWKQFPVLLGITVIYLLISSAAALLQLAVPVLNSVFSPVYSILLVNPLGFGVAFAYLRAARDEPVKVEDMFAGFNNYGNVVVAGLLVNIIVVVGFMFLIVPGIILTCKLAFTPFLVMDRKLTAIDAIKESWRLTGGHSGTVFLIMLLAIPITFVGCLCLGIGIIPAFMWIALAIASLYHSVSKLNQASPQPGVPPE
jgi:uncharacterized membrane protein